MMLPPDPPPPSVPGAVANGNAHDPGSGVEAGAIRPVAGLAAGQRRPIALFRLLLLALSTIGVGAAFVLLVSGHAATAARVLSGDVLLVFGILMIA